MESQGQRYEKLKLINGVLVSTIVLFNTSITLAVDNSTATYKSSPLKEMERQYERLCIETSLIEKIQLSRGPERRKQKQRECTQEAWLNRAYDVVDGIYSQHQISDTHLRSHIKNSLDSSIFNSQKNEPKFSDIGFQAFQNKTNYPSESSTPPVDTLESFKTLTP